MDADGKSFAVSKEQIEERRRGQSAMPADAAKMLSKFDLRDLVEYLSQQK
jgi:quinoprotein glucose dehydrogenase